MSEARNEQRTARPAAHCETPNPSSGCLAPGTAIEPSATVTNRLRRDCTCCAVAVGRGGHLSEGAPR